MCSFSRKCCTSTRRSGSLQARRSPTLTLQNTDRSLQCRPPSLPPPPPRTSTPWGRAAPRTSPPQTPRWTSPRTPPYRPRTQVLVTNNRKPDLMWKVKDTSIIFFSDQIYKIPVLPILSLKGPFLIDMWWSQLCNYHRLKLIRNRILAFASVSKL